MKPKNLVDLSGQVYGRLTVISRVPAPAHIKTSSSRVAWWLCRCACGNDKITATNRLSSGATRSCGCLLRESGIAKQKELAVMARGEPGVAGLGILYGSYKRSAKRRGIVWDLSMEDFQRITSGNCLYCGTEPSLVSVVRTVNQEHSAYFYNGIDRVDSDGVYAPLNCVSCCSICNRAKLTSTIEEWDEWILRIRNSRYLR